MSTFEFRPSGSAAVAPEARQVPWEATDVDPVILRCEVDAWLREFGLVPDRAIDLARLALGVYVADQLTPRGKTFTRSIDLSVHVLDSDPYQGGLLDDIADLLASLTGDTWTLNLVPDTATRPDPLELKVSPVDRVSLLSGGLDSFAGAVLLSGEDEIITAYLGHWNQSPVKRAQNAIRDYFRDAGRPIDYTQIRIGVTEKGEGSTRSRALLFMALGVAASCARGARTLVVPENGYTSINPPLGQDRGGALTTRSTHPRTMAAVNRILADLCIGVTIANPHAGQTKGDLIAAAMAAAPAPIEEIAAATYSCAKPVQGIKGANPNDHCGNCVACIIRRGAFLAAGLADATRYVSVYVTGAGRIDFDDQRSADAEAVKRAVLTPFEDIDLLAIGPFPDDFDFDAAVDLCNRGLLEISLVPL